MFYPHQFLCCMQNSFHGQNGNLESFPVHFGSNMHGRSLIVGSMRTLHCSKAICTMSTCHCEGCSVCKHFELAKILNIII